VNDFTVCWLTLCAGATGLDSAVMFQCYWFVPVKSLCIAWASGGAALSRLYDPGFGVFALTFAGKRFSFPDQL